NIVTNERQHYVYKTRRNPLLTTEKQHQQANTSNDDNISKHDDPATNDETFKTAAQELHQNDETSSIRWHQATTLACEWNTPTSDDSKESTSQCERSIEQAIIFTTERISKPVEHYIYV
ncbi:10677_t:CDS:2, partial [Gigaspora rosea]